METFLAIIDILLTFFIFFSATFAFGRTINFGKRIRELEKNAKNWHVCFQDEVKPLLNQIKKDLGCEEVGGIYGDKKWYQESALKRKLDVLCEALGLRTEGKGFDTVTIYSHELKKWDALLEHLGIEWKESKTKEGFVKKKKEKKA